MSRPFVVLVLLLTALVFPISSALAQSNQTRLYTTRDGIAGDVITALAFEPNGSAWVGTTQGVTHISDAGWVSYTRVHGLGDSWVTGLAVAPDGRIWMGTQSGGLSVFDPAQKSFTTYTLNNSAIPSNFITALAADQQNNIWMGTLNNGVARYEPASNQWTSYSLPDNSITALSLDDNNALWVGTTAGAFHLSNNNWTRDPNIGLSNVRRIDAFGGKWFLTTDIGRFVLSNDAWQTQDGSDEIEQALQTAGFTDRQVTAFGKDEQQRYWLGTPNGLWLVSHGNNPEPPKPLPVVLIHGWTVTGDDTLESSEFHFLKSYADRDGIPMYYIQGVKPENTLYQNAAIIRDAIAQVKKETGADKVNMIGFSMGGMNTRAYLETSLYANDVNRAIILGTPQAGVEVWKPILAQEILSKPRQPSAIELSPEYAQLVNATRMPNPSVTYDLIIGDARDQAGLDFLQNLPPSDALISVNSALSLKGPTVNHHVNSDLHDWSPQSVPLDLTAYLYPQDTWQRYMRNVLRNGGTAPAGSEIASPAPPVTTIPIPNHTPVITADLATGETVTRTVLIDDNKSARFLAYYPGGKIDFSLIAPNGKTYEPTLIPHADGSGVLSLSTDVASFSGYVVKNASVGTWQLILKRTDGGTAPLSVSTYAELDSSRHLVAHQDGSGSIMTAFLDPDAPDVQLTAQVAIPGQAPGAPFTTSPLLLNPDDANGFTAPLPDHGPGWYVVFVTATGSDFERQAEFLYNVPASGAAFRPGIPVQVHPALNNSVIMDVSVNVTASGAYALSATVQRAADNTVVARTFTPLNLTAGTQTVPVTVDTTRLPHATYTVTFSLYDTRWAATPLQSATPTFTWNYQE